MVCRSQYLSLTEEEIIRVPDSKRLCVVTYTYADTVYIWVTRKTAGHWQASSVSGDILPCPHSDGVKYQKALFEYGNAFNVRKLVIEKIYN